MKFKCVCVCVCYTGIWSIPSWNVHFHRNWTVPSKKNLYRRTTHPDCFTPVSCLHHLISWLRTELELCWRSFSGSFPCSVVPFPSLVGLLVSGLTMYRILCFFQCLSVQRGESPVELHKSNPGFCVHHAALGFPQAILLLFKTPPTGINSPSCHRSS